MVSSVLVAVCTLVMCTRARRRPSRIVENNDSGSHKQSLISVLYSSFSFSSSGTISREKNAGIRFGLSAEEIGLILNQLPQQNPVEFSRRPAPNEGFFDGPSAPHKVCKIVPDPTVATVNFIIDFEKDGVGGQEVQGITGPMEVTAQAGEMQVIMEIMRSTLPVLVGWTTTQDLAMQKSVGFAISAGSSGGSAPEESGYQA